MRSSVQSKLHSEHLMKHVGSETVVLRVSGNFCGAVLFIFYIKKYLNVDQIVK